MITLKELFDDLSFGEFANMALGTSINGGMPVDKYPKVVSLINLALLDLYTRFPLKEKEFKVYQRAGKSIYYVRADYMGDPLAGDPEVYIDGTGEDPPNGDIIKFTRAFDELGVEVAINKIQCPDGIFLPEPDVLKMVVGDVPKVISMVYQAAYPKIMIDVTFNPVAYNLYFPSFLKMALLAHVAARLFVGKDSSAVEGEPGLNNTFQYKYETECLKIEKLSLAPGVDEEFKQFESNGWV